MTSRRRAEQGGDNIEVALQTLCLLLLATLVPDDLAGGASRLGDTLQDRSQPFLGLFAHVYRNVRIEPVSVTSEGMML